MGLVSGMCGKGCRSKGSFALRIMCLNGWGGKLHEALIPYLRASAPDILCLQEVVHTPESDAAWLTYRDGDHALPQRANLFHEVARALPDHVATFCPAAQGVLWDGQMPIPSQWGLARFVRSAFPVIGQIQDFVHKAYAPDGYGAHPRSVVAHAIRVFDHARNWPVSIVQMHGLRDLNGKMDTPERLTQAQRLVNLARRIAAPADRLILCGDFNVAPDSETFRILAGIGLHDLVTARGFAGTRTSHYTKPGRFADYMLVNRAVEVIDFNVVTTPEVSDHCPLVLEI
jgi:endonuclease/exonuclease/phosphatase family metal-dependent hydrolase